VLDAVGVEGVAEEGSWGKCGFAAEVIMRRSDEKFSERL
jgi:hypothetical protein